METKELLLEDIYRIAKKLKPRSKMAAEYSDGGRGFVDESFFAFSKAGSFWITILCETGRVAFKKVTPEWIHVYSDLVLSSREVFVVYDRKHHIIEWAVAQDKVCPYTKEPKEKPKEPPKDHKDSKEKPKEPPKDCKDPKEKPKEPHKDCKEPKEKPKEPPKDCKDPKEKPKDCKEKPKDCKEPHHHDHKDHECHKEHHCSKNHKENKYSLDLKKLQMPKK